MLTVDRNHPNYTKHDPVVYREGWRGHPSGYNRATRRRAAALERRVGKTETTDAVLQFTLDHAPRINPYNRPVSKPSLMSRVGSVFRKLKQKVGL